MLRCIFSNDSEIVCVLHMYIIRKKNARLEKKIFGRRWGDAQAIDLMRKCFLFFFFPVVIP